MKTTIKQGIILFITLINGFSLFSQADTKGTDFWLAFGRNSAGLMQIRIVGGEQATTGTINFTALATSVPFSIAAGEVVTYNLVTEKPSVSNTATGISSRSVHIISSAPVTAYALNQQSATTDATNILPTPVLGTDYYQISYTPGDLNWDIYLVVATENNTHIYHDNTLEATLNAGQVYCRTSYLTDMTGSHITSDRPVAFFVANTGCNIPVGFSYQDILFQQLAPVNTWGKNFFVPVSNLTRDIIRIMVSRNGTNIVQTGGTLLSSSGSQMTLTNLNAGQWVEMQVSLANNGCYIQTDKPVGICTYLTSGQYNNAVIIPQRSDPAEAWLPAVEQLVSSALIAPFVPSSGTQLNEHFALIVTPTATKNLTTVKIGTGTEQPLSGGTWYDNAAAGMSFYDMKLTASNTESYLYSNPVGKLFVMGYGTGAAESYYYLASSAMRNLEAAFYVNDIHYQDLSHEVICSQPLQFRAELQVDLSSLPGRLKWYIDSVEETTVRDMLTWSKTMAAGTYQVKLVALLDDDITTKTVEGTLTVASLVAPPITPSGIVSICLPNTSIQLSTVGDSCRWFKDGVAIPNVTSNTYTATTSGIYTVVILYTDCTSGMSDTANVLFGGFIQAYNDYAQTLVNMPVSVSVLDNDSLGCCKLSGLTALSIVSGQNGKNGTATFSGNTLIYTPNANFIGKDSIIYTYTCSGIITTAKVYFNVLDLPDNITDADCYINRPAGAWSIKQRFVSNTVAGGAVFEMSVPLVGDIDGDGIVEIVVAGQSTATNNFNCDSIKVFDGLHNTVKNKFKVEAFHGGFGTIAMADVDKDGFAEIFVASNFAASTGNQGYIFCYKYDGTLKWKSAAVYTANATSHSYPYLKITDFNGDGIPEILANDRIFNAVTGDLLLDCGLIAGGLDYGTNGGHNSYYPGGYFGNFSSTADMDGDALPEIVAGRNIYKISINSLTNPALNSRTLLRSVIPGTHSTDLGDGYTSVADLNLDGTLDVIVLRQNPAARATKYLYAWDGKTGELLHTNIVSLNDGNGSYGGSIPFVGDLDGDGVPEISFTLTSRLHAYKLDNNTKTLNPMAWSPLTTTDVSGATTLTLFDFNQDNQMELVYRDQDNLRIVDGMTGQNKTTIPCFSWTMNEYPVVADVTGGGHANIVVLGKPAAASHGNGYLYVFEHDLSVSGSIPWAPTRKVWNQWAYNVVNINEDLTVPKYQMNPATVFSGSDSVLGTSDDVRPYNGFLMQQTLIDKRGVPIWLTPNVYTTLPLIQTTASKNAVTVSVKMVNQGDAAIGSPVYAALYKKKTPQTFTLADTIATGSANIQIRPGDTGTVTIFIPNLTTFFPMTGVVVRVNDNGRIFPVQPECDATNDTLSIMAAVGDYAQTIKEIPITIDVLGNDVLNLCPTLIPSIVTPPPTSAGSVTVSGNKIIFTPASGYIGETEFTYQITCNGQISVAKVIARVLEYPDNIVDADCYGTPPLFQWAIKKDYQSVNSTFHNYAIPLVGDINGDQIPEIIALSSDTRSLIILWGHNRDTSRILMREMAAINTNSGGSISPYAMCKTKIGGVDKNIIVVKMNSANSNRLDAYDLNGPADQSASPLWSIVGGTHGESVNIADFDNDGIPEVYISDRIYNIQTGQLLASGSGNKGYANVAYFTVAADVNNDGKLELIIGNQVYAVNIPNKTSSTGNNLTLLAQMQDSITFLNGSQARQGFTVVADITGDENLDIIYIASDNPGYAASNLMLIAWDFASKSMICKSDELHTDKGIGIPFVGNIDNDPGLEVVFMVKHRLVGYKPNLTTKKFDLAYSTTVVDESGATGMTIFDFNNDGNAEIVYRDEFNLRILTATPGNPGVFSNLATYNCASTTYYEYPIVADVDNDGASEIIVVGNTAGNTRPDGYLWIYKSGNQFSWAPARKVWNQYAYNPVYVNEDLTILPYPMNPATKFAGQDGVLGTSDDVQPYNNFLKQQTTLNTEGTPLWLMPNVYPDPSSVTTTASGDSVIVTVKIVNDGNADAAIGYPVYATLYKKKMPQTFTSADTIASGSANIQIRPGDTGIVSIYIKDITKFLPLTSIVVRVNDNGLSFPVQSECDSTNDTLSIMAAVGDYAQTIKEIPITIDVLNNDVLNLCPTLIPAILTPPPSSAGSVTVSGNKIIFTPASGYIGETEFTYQITCNGQISTAKVIVRVLEYPDNIVDADCYGTPPVINWDYKLLMISPAADNVAAEAIPLVGDIDKDGKIEIVVAARGATTSFLTQKLFIFEVDAASNQIIKQQEIAIPNASQLNNVYSIGNVDGNDYAAIFLATSVTNNTVATDQGQLIKYVYNGTQYVESWRRKYTALNTKQVPQPMLVDFNNDSIPEVLVYDKIFNARTGDLLVDAGYLSDATKGFGLGGHLVSGASGWTPATTFALSSMMSVADIDGDGIPEVIGGNCVYKVNIVNTAGIGGNSFTLLRQASTAGHPEVMDGATAVADMDGDGLLDVIVTTAPPTGNAALYMWNPRTGEVMNANVINNLPRWSDFQSYCGVSVPFIGDIDKDGLPEVCLTARFTMLAYDYDTTSKQLIQKWNKTTADASGATTMVMFDFDQDGSNELVYRDETNLRIINGADGTDKILSSISCLSTTANEYPLVVDINHDDAAEIVVTGGPNSTTFGRVMVFSSKESQQKWAPTRKVWNQFGYNVVNVNEDLTSPNIQMNPALIFPGGNRPFNGYLMQQTMLNKDGDPLWLLPNVYPDPSSVTTTASDNSVTVSVKMVNQGDAAIGSPVYATLYKKKTPQTFTLADTIATGSANIQILPGDTGTVTVFIPNITKFFPMTDIVIRLNDNGLVFPVQPECDTTNDTLTISVSVKADSTYIKPNADTVYICYNTSPSLSVQTALVPSPKFRWYDTQTSTAILHEGNTFIPNPLKASRSYFVSVHDTTGPLYENDINNRREIRVVVYDSLKAGIIGYSHSVCITVKPNVLQELLAKSGGSNIVSYQWQSSLDSLSWSNISGATATTYSPDLLSTTTFFRRIDMDGMCGTVYTNVIKVTVNNFPVLNTEITGPHVVCVGNTIQLSNTTTGGVWTVNNSNATIANPNANPETVTGAAAGNAYITYTINNGQCETKKTFLLKVIPPTAPTIKIGFEH